MTESNRQRYLFDHASRLLSLFVIFPILLLCAGYLYNVGYYTALGAPWLAQELDRTSIIEKGLFPLTSFFLWYIIPLIVVRRYPRMKRYCSLGIYACAYLLLIGYSSFFFGLVLHEHPLLIEAAYFIWALLVAFYTITFIYRVKLRIDAFTSYISLLVIGFGFLILNEQYGYTAGWRMVENRDAIAEGVILKNHRFPEALWLISAKGPMLHVLDLNTTMTYTDVNNTSHTTHISSVRLIDPKDVEMIIPAGCYPRPRLDAPETPHGIIRAIKDIVKESN